MKSEQVKNLFKLYREQISHVLGSLAIIAFACALAVMSTDTASPGTFGANPLPTDGYDSYLSAPLNSSDATVYVNELPSGVTSSIYTIFASDGRTVSEKISCTGKSSSPNRLTTCTRGLSLTPNSDGSVDETAGTGVSHSKNARIAITDTINFSGKALAILNGDQVSGDTTFDVGESTTTAVRIYADSSGKYFYARNGDSNLPFLRYNEATNKWQFSDDGTNTTDLATTSAAGLSASSTRGIGIMDSFIYGIVSTTQGFYFDAAGFVSRYSSSTKGIAADSNGTYIKTTTTLAFDESGNLYVDGYVTSTARQIPRGDVNGYIGRGWINFDVQTFTASGTWTKPSGAQFVRVIVIGGGGGGGSGSREASGSSGNGGGAGGGGAAVSEGMFLASTLGATETVTVGSGGAGGASKSTNGNGNVGGDGGFSSFGTWIKAGGGGGGAAGETNASGLGGGGGSTLNSAAGATGGSPAVTDSNSLSGQGITVATVSTTGGNSEWGGAGGGGSGYNEDGFAGGSSIYGCPGGGGGGGLDNGATTEYVGAAGGTVQSYTAGGGGAGGSGHTTGTAGTANSALSRGYCGSAGGGGGSGAPASVNGGPGGDGGAPGAGGGGGGATHSGTALYGGNGATGRVIVFSW